jgi:hypothetical protein
MVRFVLLAILKLLPAEFQIPKPARYGFFVFCPPLSGILYQIAWSDASPARHAIADSGTGCACRTDQKETRYTGDWKGFCKTITYQLAMLP